MLLFIDWFIYVPLIKIFSTVLKSISLWALFGLSGSSFSFLSFPLLGMSWNLLFCQCIETLSTRILCVILSSLLFVLFAFPLNCLQPFWEERRWGVLCFWSALCYHVCEMGHIDQAPSPSRLTTISHCKHIIEHFSSERSCWPIPAPNENIPKRDIRPWNKRGDNFFLTWYWSGAIFQR